MITYAITVCNEWFELDRLLSILNQVLTGDYQILVQYDSMNVTAEVMSVIEYNKRENDNIVYYAAPLENEDFATFKNHIFEHATGEWIFQIDADEYPDKYLLRILPDILDSNPEVDAIAVPRVNTVFGLTSEHVQKWGWRIWNNIDDRLKLISIMSEMGEGYVKMVEDLGTMVWKYGRECEYYAPVINFPDFQWRLYKNREDIRWVNKVHEKLSGLKSFTTLPEAFDYSLWHPKKIARQEAQNERYAKIGG